MNEKKEQSPQKLGPKVVMQNQQVCSSENILACPFTTYGFKAFTIRDDNLSTDTTINYLLHVNPIGLARAVSIRDKFEVIMGDIWMNSNINGKPEVILHPMFVGLLQKLIAYDSLTYIKATEYQQIIRAELYRASDGEKGEKLKECINEIVQGLHVTRKSRPGQGEKRLKKLQYFQEQMKELISKKQERYLEEVRRSGNLFCQQAENRFQSQDLKNGGRQEQWKELLTLARGLCQNVGKIEVLRTNAQINKIKLFCKLHAQYYRTAKINNSHDIYIVKNSNEADGIMHTLDHHVFLRNVYQKKRKTINVQLIRDIALELMEYHEFLSTDKSKLFYDYVNPKNIIFDQFTLKPKLRFQPVLLEAFGLRNRPLSLENLITLFPTPQDFDYFQSPKELDQATARQVRLILNDPLYGSAEMLGDERNKFQPNQVEQLQEKVELEELKQHMMCWRFLELGYFLLNGRELGKDYEHPLNEEGKRLKLLQKLREEERSLKKSLPKLLGYRPSAQIEGEQFRLTLYGLLNYLQLQRDDAILENEKYERLKMYHNTRNILLREVIRVFVCEDILVKMYNVKKYMCMFTVLAMEILEEAKSTLESQIVKPGQRRNLRLTLDKEVKKLRDEKPYYEYMVTTFERICQYRGRNPNEDRQANYVWNQPQGKAHFQMICDMKRRIDEVMTLSKQLNLVQKPDPEKQSPEVVEKARIQFNECFQELRELVFRIYWKAKMSFHDLILQEIKPPEKQSYHKLSSKTDKLTMRAHNLFDQKLRTVVQALFHFQIDNLSVYKSLVIASLKLQEQEKQVRIKKQDQAAMNAQQNTLNLIIQILQNTSELSRRKKDYSLQSSIVTIEDSCYLPPGDFRNQTRDWIQNKRASLI